MAGKEALEIFTQHRGALMALAYRMLGSLSEAEDAVQETFLRWQNAGAGGVSDPKRWLLRVCSRLCIDQLRKAYRRRESYVGPWLPEPIPNAFRPWEENAPRQNRPDESAEERDGLSVAFLLLLEKLNPLERAVFLLHDVFHYGFREIADYVDASEESCRKAAQRARAAVRRDRPRFDRPGPESFRVLERFFAAARDGDPETLQGLLAAGSEFWSDSGGKVAAANRVLEDAAQIARFLVGLGRIAQRQNLSLRLDFTLVNDRPGLLLARQESDGMFRLETVFSFEFSGGKISRIYAMRNPEKLKGII